jgi:hypothetical protein
MTSGSTDDVILRLLCTHLVDTSRLIAAQVDRVRPLVVEVLPPVIVHVVLKPSLFELYKCGYCYTQKTESMASVMRVLASF